MGNTWLTGESFPSTGREESVLGKKSEMNLSCGRSTLPSERVWSLQVVGSSGTFFMNFRCLNSVVWVFDLSWTSIGMLGNRSWSIKGIRMEWGPLLIGEEVRMGWSGLLPGWLVLVHPGPCTPSWPFLRTALYNLFSASSFSCLEHGQNNFYLERRG